LVAYLVVEDPVEQQLVMVGLSAAEEEPVARHHSKMNWM
jgi:hypothetical protein